MGQPSMFEVMRTMGQQALWYSKDWFTDPIRVAHSYTDFQMFEGTAGRVDLRDQNDAFQSQLQSFYCSGILAGRWAMSGYPTVTMGHRTAAALMGTKIKREDVVEFVRAPWPAFAVRLPSKMLYIEEEGELREASLLLATEVDSKFLRELPDPGPEYAANMKYAYTNPTRWWYKLMADSPVSFKPTWLKKGVEGFFSGISLWGFNMPLEFLGTLTGGQDAEGYEEWNTHLPIPIDKRSDHLARMLLIGSCLHLSGDPREREARNSEDGIKVVERRSKQREGDELPAYTEFQVTSSIKVNLHHAIRDYVEHGGSAPSVQTMVSGHWKRVAYGKGREFRRLQHINPYWRGDINAPISTRVK